MDVMYMVFFIGIISFSIIVIIAAKRNEKATAKRMDAAVSSFIDSFKEGINNNISHDFSNIADGGVYVKAAAINDGPSPCLLTHIEPSFLKDSQCINTAFYVDRRDFI